jgi:hypothetical protein
MKHVRVLWDKVEAAVSRKLSCKFMCLGHGNDGDARMSGIELRDFLKALMMDHWCLRSDSAPAAVDEDIHADDGNLTVAPLQYNCSLVVI